MTLPTPSAITAFAAHLADDTGGQITIEHKGARRWRITSASGRVLVWIEYEVLSRGRLKWAQSQLFVDGQQTDRAGSYAGLIDIFRDPDGTNPEPEPQWEEVSAADAPPAVRRLYGKVSAVLPRLPVALALVVRRAGRRWVVAIENERVTLRCNFVTPLMDPLRPAQVRETRRAKQPIELVIDGSDMTAQINGQIDKALGMLVAHAAAPAAPAVARETPAAVNTGVNVRKQSVMRI